MRKLPRLAILGHDYMYYANNKNFIKLGITLHGQSYLLTHPTIWIFLIGFPIGTDKK